MTTIRCPFLFQFAMAAITLLAAQIHARCTFKCYLRVNFLAAAFSFPLLAGIHIGLYSELELPIRPMPHWQNSHIKIDRQTPARAVG